MTQPAARVDLTNCDREPIHIPGLIQPHGALLALDAQGRVGHASANLRDWLGDTAPALGGVVTAQHFEGNPAVHGLLAQVAALPPATGTPAALHAVVTLAGRSFDVVVHRLHGWVIAEFEQRGSNAPPPQYFGPLLLDATQRFRSQPDVQALLEESVRALRALTGFDRVMAYRFRADDSGDIVAEDRHPDLDPYLGWRYPASDIPAQARRLYTVNLMRLIADVCAAPVALQSLPPADEPLDMSHAVLRSVSPIHIEYLQNIGVGASMSLSIVRDGRLWGMLACHHRQPLHLPYTVRSACAVLTELLTAHLQTHAVAEQAAQSAAHQRLRSAVLDSLPQAANPASVLSEQAPELMRLFQADAMLVAGQTGVQVFGDVPPALATEIKGWLRAQDFGPDGVLATATLGACAPALAPQLAGWCGLLAMRYDSAASGILALLRREQIEHVSWGHRPHKAVQAGPLGPRLTPPGSFALWRETVRGTAMPWSGHEQAALGELCAGLRRFIATRLAEMHRHRAAVATMLQRGEARAAAPPEDGGHVDRLLRQVMDLSLVQHGRLLLAKEALAFDKLLLARVDQLRRRHAGVSLFYDTTRLGETTVTVRGDAARLTQLLDGLLDNAVQHGTAGESIIVRLRADAERALVEVSNVSPPLEPATLHKLFQPDASAAAHEDSRTGLGVGLYITRAIAQAHGGDLAYNYDEPFVTMTVQLPRVPG